MEETEAKLNEEVATRIMGWHKETVQDDSVNGGKPWDQWVSESGAGIMKVEDWTPSFVYIDAFNVIQRMEKKYSLCCRIGYASSEQISVVFYFPVGSQYIYNEKIERENLKGLATCESFGRAVCEAALQADANLK